MPKKTKIEEPCIYDIAVTTGGQYEFTCQHLKSHRTIIAFKDRVALSLIHI